LLWVSYLSLRHFQTFVSLVTRSSPFLDYYVTCTDASR